MILMYFQLLSTITACRNISVFFIFKDILLQFYLLILFHCNEPRALIIVQHFLKSHELMISVSGVLSCKQETSFLWGWGGGDGRRIELEFQKIVARK